LTAAEIAQTRYTLDGLEIKSQWGRDILCRPEQLQGQPNFLYNGYRVFLGAEAAPTHLLEPGCEQVVAVTLLPLCDYRGMSWGYLHFSLP